ncbi:MAG: glycosyltransferase [Gemmatimonadaceae bacterium]
MSATSPVFIDSSGRRGRRVRGAVLATGVITTLLGLGVAASLMMSEPVGPELQPAILVPSARPMTGKAERERTTLRRLLERAIATTKAVPQGRHARLPAKPIVGTKPNNTGKPIVAGFFVSWDDNSYASLDTNIKHLDWIVGEWAFVDPSGDSLDIQIDKPQASRVIVRDTLEPPGHRPQVMLMVSNFEGSTQAFRAGALLRLLSRPASRARAIEQLRRAVARYGLGGVLVDFEVGATTADIHAPSVQFTRELRAMLSPMNKTTSYAVPSYISDTQLRDAGNASDKLFAMLFDEHYGGGDPGPIASQQFYESSARRLAGIVPADKLILMMGAYGYDWNDLPSSPGHPRIAEERTFQQVVTALRDSGATMHFDSRSLNPYVRYTSPDSTDHLIWYLDGVTAYNEMRIAENLHAAGVAVWRLGSEDPSLWRAIGPDGRTTSAESLKVVPPGYDPEIDHVGEIIRIRARPTDGSRTLRVDATTGLVADEAFITFPTPFIEERYGLQAKHPHWIALTFDDGPDAAWTPAILDTLKSRNAKATFFVIGVNADRHTRLLQRVYDEGQEIGNHTYSHPNLGLTADSRTRREIDLNERLIESVIGRRTALFRPPYFGDAEPTTIDELNPVAIASDQHYLTVGLHVDSEDWRSPPVDSIIANVLTKRDEMLDTLASFAKRHADTTIAANVILLHDGGGNRSNTVRALGPLIDSLRARGDTFVLVSTLAGLTRDEAMPPLAAVGTARRLLTLVGFQVLGLTEWLMFWFFTIAVILGIARLLLIGTLAVIQRIKRHQDRDVPTTFAPGVTVIVPAFNEERVIARTIESLLNQQYAGDIDILVVDDGSSDDTYGVALSAFGTHPRVSVHKKPNAGKASALNFGLALAKGEFVVCLDADTIFAMDAIAELVQPLEDSHVGAVAGNAKVGNRINLVTRWQAVEYVTTQNLDRRAFSLLDCITVVPGAVGAWRRSVVLEIGGFREDTLAEDQDLTLSVRRLGYSVAYADGAVAYTEAPGTLRGLAKQRFRWSFGTLQCAWKHRDALFNPKYGSLGWFALPNVWLFQLILPAISPIADLMFVWSLVSVWITWNTHGGNYALSNLEQVLAYYSVFLIVDWLAGVGAFFMESGEDKNLTWLILLQRFAYRQVMYWVVVRSFVAAITGRVVGWGKLERMATVDVMKLKDA